MEKTQCFVAIQTKHCVINNFMYGAGDGNRTHDNSLEGCGFTIKLHPHYWFYFLLY